MIEQHWLTHAHICVGCHTLSVFNLCNERIIQSYSSSAQMASTPVEAVPTKSLTMLEMTCPFYVRAGQSEEVEKFHPNFTHSSEKYAKHGHMIQPVECRKLAGNKIFEIYHKDHR